MALDNINCNPNLERCLLPISNSSPTKKQSINNAKITTKREKRTIVLY